MERSKLEKANSLVKLKSPTARVEELFDARKFTHPCQGEVNLSFGVYSINYAGDTWPEDEEGNELPSYFLILNDPKLGSAAILINDLRKKELAAGEITDPLCRNAGCNGGAMCIKKR